MREVATLAGVSIKTVSRVVNREPHVTPSTAAQVLLAIAQLNYQLDTQAANLRRKSRRSGTEAPLACQTCGRPYI
jgi:LacI family transcriptional regulator